uniref:Uncharacterized protein n=1 Tax=Ditylenchus dipsaci TaxID=166011 RepID=A0A915DAV6_9BILA
MPKLLVADGSPQVTAGTLVHMAYVQFLEAHKLLACREEFGEASRWMSYAHVTMDFNKELPKASVLHAATDEIKNDSSSKQFIIGAPILSAKSLGKRSLEKFRRERRTVIHIFYKEEHIWLVPSSNCPAHANLEEMWSELRGKKRRGESEMEVQ